MAARRLVILMVVLLAASTVAAALAPQSDQSDDETTTTATTTTEVAPPDRVLDRELVHATIDSGAETPRTIEVEIGDQLALVVETPEPVQIEIPGFGLLEDADPDAPARFDLLVAREGKFPVRALTLEDGDRVLGTIAVSESAAGELAKGS